MPDGARDFAALALHEYEAEHKRRKTGHSINTSSEMDEELQEIFWASVHDPEAYVGAGFQMYALVDESCWRCSGPSCAARLCLRVRGDSKWDQFVLEFTCQRVKETCVAQEQKMTVEADESGST